MAVKISTKGRYGLRAMMELGLHHPEGPVMLSTIAENQGISEKYLHAILSSLKAAGLIRSIRGAGGGYCLVHHPKQIRLSEIMRALEGSLSLSDCISDTDLCERSKDCSTRLLWVELNEMIWNRLSDLSLSDIVELERKKRYPPLMYNI